MTWKARDYVVLTAVVLILIGVAVLGSHLGGL